MVRKITIMLAAALGICANTSAWAVGPLSQWNAMPSISLSDTDNNGSELIMVVPLGGAQVEPGCSYVDAYVVRDPIIIHSALAMMTTALAMGWAVLLQTSGACDVSTGRPLVSGVQISPSY